MEVVHQRIKQERETLPITQTELGEKIGVGRSTVSNWEAGRKTPDTETLYKLADIFNCSMDYLWGRTDNRQASVIKETIDGNIIEIEIDKEYFKNCTPGDIKQILNDIKDAGFDVKKLIE